MKNVYIIHIDKEYP